MPEVWLTRCRSRTTSSRPAPNSGIAPVSGVSGVSRPALDEPQCGEPDDRLRHREERVVVVDGCRAPPFDAERLECDDARRSWRCRARRSAAVPRRRGGAPSRRRASKRGIGVLSSGGCGSRVGGELRGSAAQHDVSGRRRAASARSAAQQPRHAGHHRGRGAADVRADRARSAARRADARRAAARDR